MLSLLRYEVLTSSGFSIIGLICFLIWGGPNGRAIGLALVLFGFSVLFIDHFSEERADTYYQEIIKYSQ